MITSINVSHEEFPKVVVRKENRKSGIADHVRKDGDVFNFLKIE